MTRGLAVTTALLAVGTIAWFWLLNEVPPSQDCGDATTAAGERAEDEWRRGVIPLHVVLELVAIAAIVALRRSKWPLIAVAVFAVLGVPLMWGGGVVLAYGGQVAGPQALAAVAVAAIAAGACFDRAARVLVWSVALLAPGHCLVVLSWGDPLFC